ncbi:MAG TPA: glycosyltransferase family 2 protein [candidate division Zixibacteria bacterium]|nr:glycosyltransferase family 2 protein [candidate division Zixibacteria bacterium]
MKTTLLVLTLNEIEGMKAIMPRVDRTWCDQIIVLDGGSVDGTIEYAKENGYFVYVQRAPGIRNAYKEVLPYVEGDVIVTFSPDGNCIPELIPALIDKMREGYDMVIGSRYLGGARSEDDDPVTALGNWLFTQTVNVLHGGRYTDVMNIFRAYKTQLIYDLGLDKDDPYSTAERIFRTTISWEPLLSVRAAKRKLKVTEIPADEPPRLGGVRKLQVFRWGGAYYFQFIREKFCGC